MYLIKYVLIVHLILNLTIKEFVLYWQNFQCIQLSKVEYFLKFILV
jgi:hypothetical protein